MQRALAIYGPDVASTLKGKMTRAGAVARAPTFEAVPIPLPIRQHHCNVTLCIDFFLVQGVPSLHTISRGICYRTAVPVADRSYNTILNQTRSVIKLYTLRGFHVRDIHADEEFDYIRADVLPINLLNVVAADGHVGEVERSIRPIKARVRACAHGLPYRHIPKIMIRHMVADIIRCLNQFPRKNGISQTLSPTTIVAGHARPDYNSMKIEFGAYAQGFDDHTPPNTPAARSIGAIILNSTGNAQGAYNFISLATGACISRHRWTELPILDTAIARVEALALRGKMPLLQRQGLVVEWRNDQVIDDDEYDLDYAPPNHPDDVPNALSLSDSIPCVLLFLRKQWDTVRVE